MSQAEGTGSSKALLRGEHIRSPRGTGHVALVVHHDFCLDSKSNGDSLKGLSGE